MDGYDREERTWGLLPWFMLGKGTAAAESECGGRVCVVLSSDVVQDSFMLKMLNSESNLY